MEDRQDDAARSSRERTSRTEIPGVRDPDVARRVGIRPGRFFVLSEAFSIGERFALSEQIRR